MTIMTSELLLCISSHKFVIYIYIYTLYFANAGIQIYGLSSAGKLVLWMAWKAS